MKILIVNSYAAIYSIGKITSLQYKYLKQFGHEVRVCYKGTIRESKMVNQDFIPIASKIEAHLGRFIARLTGYEGYTHPFSTRRLIRFTRKFHPDVVQVNVLHGYYINGNAYLRFLKKQGYKVCYTMMDEYAYMGKCAFSFSCNKFQTRCTAPCPERKTYPQSLLFDRAGFIFEAKRKTYADFRHIVFTGPEWVVNRAKSSALLKQARLEILDEPVDFGTTFHPRETGALRAKLGIPLDKKIIVTVAPLSDPRKGGIYFFKVAEQLLDRQDLHFVYVGCDVEPPMKLKNMTTVPFVHSQDDLAQYYSLGDLFVCTSLADSMPNVCIDALGCGTPLAGFAEAGTPYVAPPEFGTFTPTYDLEALARVIIETPKKDAARIAACHEYAVHRYAPENIIAKLAALYPTL